MSLEICAISDTHGKHRELKIPEADLLLYAGDITSRGESWILADFNKWIEEQGIPCIACAGNHDLSLDGNIGYAKTLLKGITYLDREVTKFKGLKIYGSPMARRVGTWAFGYSPTEAKKSWSKIPENLDILLTHGPPYQILDLGPYGDEFGCLELYRKVQKVQPKFHIFGHIHFCGGRKLRMGKTTFINCAVADETYNLTNNIITFSI